MPRIRTGSGPRRRAPRPLLAVSLMLAVLLCVSSSSEARKLRSARLSPSATSSLLGMPEGGGDGGDDKAPPTLLFTLQSESAFLQLGELPEAASEAEDAADFDRGTLTLRGVAPTAVWFAERPSRAAGAMPTSRLASDALDVDVDDGNEADKTKKRAWLGVPNVALTGTLEKVGAGSGSPSAAAAAAATEGEEETVTAVLTVLGRPRYDERERTLTADVRVVPMKVESPGQEAAATTTATKTTSLPPPHSPPEQLSQQRRPRSVSLTRAALLIDQLPMSEGYIGNNYGFANDCLSTMSPSCNAFAGTGFYRPGFVGWLGGQMGPGNVPKYPPSRGGWQAPASSSSNSQSPPPPSSPSPPPPPPPSNGGSGQVYMMSQPYDPSKG